MSVSETCISFFASLFFLAALAALPAHGQPCPTNDDPKEFSAPSQPLSLKGKLIYHDGLRQWFELKLDQPQCEQTSVQLLPEWGHGDWKPIEALRGCRVISQGPLDFSPTGYYSLRVFQSVQHIEPVGKCPRKPPFPDASKAKPDKNVRQYRVDMDVNIAPGDHPVRFHVTSDGKELHPWQTYAGYQLNGGGDFLRGSCGEGFVVDKVLGTPQTEPSHLDKPGTDVDMASFFIENATDNGKTKLRLSYTCVRKAKEEKSE